MAKRVVVERVVGTIVVTVVQGSVMFGSRGGAGRGVREVELGVKEERETSQVARNGALQKWSVACATAF